MSQETQLQDRITCPVHRFKDGALTLEDAQVAAEIPLTIQVNDREIGTMLCTPTHLASFVYGFLFTSGFIRDADDVISVDVDEKKWRADVQIRQTVDPDMYARRVYTSGCGKGVMYTTLMELSGRHPVPDTCRIQARDIIAVMTWLIRCSELHRETGGVHSAAASISGALPAFHIDDIGRHNAVDKVIGRLLRDRTDCASVMLACTGRISSEILHKARRMAIPVLASRGAPTHQGILLAQEMGITLACFIRQTNFAVFTHPQRILLTESAQEAHP